MQAPARTRLHKGRRRRGPGEGLAPTLVTIVRGRGVISGRSGMFTMLPRLIAGFICRFGVHRVLLFCVVSFARASFGPLRLLLAWAFMSGRIVCSLCLLLVSFVCVCVPVCACLRVCLVACTLVCCFARSFFRLFGCQWKHITPFVSVILYPPLSQESVVCYSIWDGR